MLLGGFVAELMVFAIAIPIAIVEGQEGLFYTAAPASFIAAFMCGWWVAKRAASRRIPHGLLVGAAAMAIYVAAGLGRPEPAACVIAHALSPIGPDDGTNRRTRLRRWVCAQADLGQRRPSS
jgi:hypothetical protein